MNNQSIWFGIIGLIFGALVSFIAATAWNNKSEMPQPSPNIIQQEHTTMKMDQSNLNNKTGDDFDKAFIEEMIVHHQGAIDMANQAKQKAKHNEIKQMADDIIAAQSKEIDLMNQWKKDWGY